MLSTSSRPDEREEMKHLIFNTPPLYREDYHKHSYSNWFDNCSSWYSVVYSWSLWWNTDTAAVTTEVDWYYKNSEVVYTQSIMYKYSSTVRTHTSIHLISNSSIYLHRYGHISQSYNDICEAAASWVNTWGQSCFIYSPYMDCMLY